MGTIIPMATFPPVLSPPAFTFNFLGRDVVAVLLVEDAIGVVVGTADELADILVYCEEPVIAVLDIDWLVEELVGIIDIEFELDPTVDTVAENVAVIRSEEIEFEKSVCCVDEAVISDVINGVVTSVDCTSVCVVSDLVWIMEVGTIPVVES